MAGLEEQRAVKHGEPRARDVSERPYPPIRGFNAQPRPSVLWREKHKGIIAMYLRPGDAIIHEYRDKLVVIRLVSAHKNGTIVSLETRYPRTTDGRPKR